MLSICYCSVNHNIAGYVLFKHMAYQYSNHMIGRLEQCHLFVLAPPVSSLANCSLTGPTLKKTALQLYIVHLLQTMTFNTPSPSSNSLYLFSLMQHVLYFITVLYSWVLLISVVFFIVLVRIKEYWLACTFLYFVSLCGLSFLLFSLCICRCSTQALKVLYLGFWLLKHKKYYMFADI